jgi:hypothetical protein
LCLFPDLKHSKNKLKGNIINAHNFEFYPIVRYTSLCTSGKETALRYKIGANNCCWGNS